MAVVVPYDRLKAVAYAEKWALKRNPKYLDFSSLGGDCTNFTSQCLYAGSGVMNFTPVNGWYYIDANRRTASWTGVQFLYNFLVTNKSRGVFAKETGVEDMKIGDVIQLGNERGNFYHSLVVTRVDGYPGIDTIFISTHTIDSDLRLLNTYSYAKIRFLHIGGVYK